MRKLILPAVFIAAVLVATSSRSQNLHNSNWLFGHNAGVDLSSGLPNPITGSTFRDLTSASVSDDNGRLLFYTDGITVWNKNHVPMLNGNATLHGGAGRGGTQTVVIVPKPNNSGKYYIFSNGPSNPQGQYSGIFYSLVDMAGDGGLGEVMTSVRNIPLKDEFGTLLMYDQYAGSGLRSQNAKMTTALHHDGDKIWVTIFTHFGISANPLRRAYSYLVTEQGINFLPDGGNHMPYATSPLSNFLYYPANPPRYSGIEGVIKISPNGRLLGEMTYNRILLFSFDNTAGTVLFDHHVATETSGFGPFAEGLEFSPNSQYLYFPGLMGNIYQDGRVNEAAAAATTVHVFQAPVAGKGIPVSVGSFELPGEEPLTGRVVPISGPRSGNLQLARDGKIYVCNLVPGFPNFFTYLGIIHSPDNPAASANYDPSGVLLSPNTWHEYSLPQWVHKPAGLWPKAYGTADGPYKIMKDNQGNVIMTPVSIWNGSTFYNHAGVFPPPSWTWTVNVHYNAAGTTNWLMETDDPVFAFSNGTVQMMNASGVSYYINGGTGNVVTPPVSIGNNEMIIAETTNGSVLTKYNSFNSGGIKAYPPSAAPVTLNFSTQNINFYKYNRNTNELFILLYNMVTGYQFRRYQYTGSAFNLTLNVPVSLTIWDSFVMDEQNNAYFIDLDGVLKQYDYLNPVPNTIFPVIVPGLNNTGLFGSFSNSFNNYTDGKLVAFNPTDNYLYLVDLNAATLGAKKIFTENFTATFNHTIDGDALYMSGWYCSFCGYQVKIGSQELPNINQNSVPIFVTKLSISGDFQRSSFAGNKTLVRATEMPALKLAVSPNPAGSTMMIKLTDDKNKDIKVASFVITGQTGRIEQMNNRYAGGPLDVSRLRTGMYFINVVTENGERAGGIFFKQ